MMISSVNTRISRHLLKIERLKQSSKNFTRIIEPLRASLGLSFGYMRVYKEGYYFILNNDLNFLIDFTYNVNRAYIFSKRDVTSILDHGYRFNMWPDLPSDNLTKVFYKHNQWNGITVSIMNKDESIEIYWFASNKSDTKAQEFFLVNKNVLIKFINYFECSKPKICDVPALSKEELFQFKDGFNFDHNNPALENDIEKTKKLLEDIKPRSITLNTQHGQIRLSFKEVNILALLSHGCTIKVIARRANIAPKTVQHHLENIRGKTHLHSRTDIISFYYDKLSKTFE